MPSISEAIIRNKTRISAGGETNAWASPSAPPVSVPASAGPTAPQDLPVGGGLPQRAMYPAQFVLASDRSDSSRGFRTGGMRTPAFPYPNPQQSTQKVTNITEIIQAAPTPAPTPSTNPVTPPPAPVAGAVLLETDGIANIDQTTLNLASGPAIDLAADGTGDVVISSPVFGPSGPGHSTGAVPDPGSSAGTTHFLREDGTFAIPPGTGGATNYQQVESAGTPLPAEPNLNFLNAVVADNPGNTSTDVTVAAIASFTKKALGGTVSITSNIQAAVDSQLVTMPAKGGPWYARVNYFYAKKNGGNHVCWAQDNLGNMFAASQGGASNNNDALAASGLSPVTYANGAAVTFIVYCIDNNNSTIEIDTSGEGGNPATLVSIPSYMQIEILSAG